MTDLDLDEADELYAAVGFRITRLRKARGLRQDDLAVAIGLTRPSIANTESGRQRVPLHTLLAIAQALGVELVDLLAVERPMPVLAQPLPYGPRSAVANALTRLGALRSSLDEAVDALAPLAVKGDGSS